MADSLPEPPLVELAARLGYTDGAYGRLPTAITHKSHANESNAGIAHNERLEFLGDAVVGLLVAHALMRAHPDVEEGTLSRLRASLVNARSLAEVARGLGLGSVLRLGRGEEQSGGRRKDSLLADAYEAVLGAVYLDRGLEAAELLVEAHLGERIVSVEVGHADRDYKTALQELVQANFHCTPAYEVSDEWGPDHAKEFEVTLHVAGELVARGVGRSKKLAEREAARRAWRQYQAEPPRKKD